MSLESDAFEIAFKTIEGITAAFVAVGAWLWTNLVKDVKAIQHQQDLQAREFDRNKLENEKSFASKVDMYGSLRDITNRLNDMDEKFDEKIDNIGTDIKTILMKLK